MQQLRVCLGRAPKQNRYAFGVEQGAIELDSALRECTRERLAAFETHRIAKGAHRHAAVAVALVEEGLGAQWPGLVSPSSWSRGAALLLTRRAASLQRHAGQWALPGGRVDEGEDAVQAALRELHEEVGLRLGPGAVLGLLDDYATRSGFVITPVVVWAGEARDLVPQESEVASVHRVPLHEFQRPPMLEPSDAEPGREILRLPFGHHWIAAPTAAVIHQFCEVVLAGRPTRVAHYDQPPFARR